MRVHGDSSPVHTLHVAVVEVPAFMPPDACTSGWSAIRSMGMFRPCASDAKYRLMSRSRSAALEVYAAAAFGASFSHTSNGL